MPIEAMKQLIEDCISMMEYHIEQTRPIHTTTVAIQAAKEALKAIEQYEKQEPVNWSVFNSGAEVASGLTFSEAWDYLTPERLAREWCAVCVVDQSNTPTTPQPQEEHHAKDCALLQIPSRDCDCVPTPQRKWVGLTDEERKQLWYEWENGHVVEAVEAKLRSKNT